MELTEKEAEVVELARKHGGYIDRDRARVVFKGDKSQALQCIKRLHQDKGVLEMTDIAGRFRLRERYRQGDVEQATLRMA